MTLSTSTYNRRLENGQIIEPTDLDDPANPIPKYGWSTYTSANGNAQSGGPAGGGTDTGGTEGGSTPPASFSSTSPTAETGGSSPTQTVAPPAAPNEQGAVTDPEDAEESSDSSVAANSTSETSDGGGEESSNSAAASFSSSETSDGGDEESSDSSVATFSASDTGDAGDGDGGEAAPFAATAFSSPASTHEHETTSSGGGDTVDASTVDCSINSSCYVSPFFLPPFRPSPLIYTEHYDIFGVLDLDTPIDCGLPPPPTSPMGIVSPQDVPPSCDSLDARIERDVTAFAEHMEQELAGLARVADASDSLSMLVTGTADAVGLDTLTTSDVFGRMGDLGNFSYALGVATFTAIAEQFNGDLAYAATACDIDVYGADLLLVFSGDSFFTYFGHDAWQTGASSQSYVLAIDFADFDFADGPVVISAEDMQEWIDEFCFLNDFVTGNLSLLETDLLATAENTFIEVDPQILTIEDQLSSTGVSAIMAITT